VTWLLHLLHSFFQFLTFKISVISFHLDVTFTLTGCSTLLALLHSACCHLLNWFFQIKLPVLLCTKIKVVLLWWNCKLIQVESQGTSLDMWSPTITPLCHYLVSSFEVGMRPHGWQQLPVLSCYSADHCSLVTLCIASRDLIGFILHGMGLSFYHLICFVLSKCVCIY